MNKTISTTKWVTRTGLLLALIVVAQVIGKMIPPMAVIFGPFNVSQLITGSLVNLILIISTVTVGLWSGIAVGVLSSILATLLGIGPIFPIITPAIATGNVILVIIIHFFFKAASAKQNGKPIQIGGIVTAAIVKCGFLWVTVPALFQLIPEIKPPQAKMLTIMFSWPQGVTAIVGGILALLVLPAVKKALDR